MNLNLNRGVRGGNLALASGAIAEGTNAATIKTTVAIPYLIDGQFYSKGITDNIAMTACAQQADLTTCLYTISINAAGTVTITKGEEVLTASLTAGKVVCAWPEPPAANAVIGGMKIVLSGGTFTCGTTDLSGAGVTDTLYNFATLPVALVTS